MRTSRRILPLLLGLLGVLFWASTASAQESGEEITVTIVEEVYGTYGGTPTAVDVVTTLFGTEVNNGDVIDITADVAAALAADPDALVPIGASAGTGYDVHFECVDLTDGLRYYAASSGTYASDPFRADFIPAGINITCFVNVMEQPPVEYDGDILFVSVEVINNSGGTAYAHEANVQINGDDVVPSFERSLFFDVYTPGASLQFRHVPVPTGPELAVDIAGEIDGYERSIVCTSNSQIGAGEFFADAVDGVITIEQPNQPACFVLFDDIGDEVPEVSVVVAVDNAFGGAMTPADGALWVGDDLVGHEETLTVDRPAALILVPQAQSGYDTSVACEVDPITEDLFSADRILANTNPPLLAKITDRTTECTVTYVENNEATFEFRVEVYNTYGGSLTLDDVENRVYIPALDSEPTVTDGEVLSTIASPWQPDRVEVAVLTDDVPGYDASTTCAHAESLDSAKHANPNVWFYIAQSREFMCRIIYTQVEPAGLAEFDLVTTVINNDGGALHSIDIPVKVNGVEVPYLNWYNIEDFGWESPQDIDTTDGYGGIAFSPAGENTLTIDVDGYRAYSSCSTIDGPGQTAEGLTHVIPSESTTCHLFLDDIGPEGPRITLTVLAEALDYSTYTPDFGGITVDGVHLSDGETKEIPVSGPFREVDVDPILGRIGWVQCQPTVRSYYDMFDNFSPPIEIEEMIRKNSDSITPCTITYYLNGEDPLTVVMESSTTNDDGGTGSPHQDRVFFDGSPLSGTVDVFAYGSYAIQAYPAVGYTKTPLTCVDDATGQPIDITGNILVGEPGQVITCSVVYNDLPGRVVFASSYDYDTPSDARFTFGGATVRAGQFRTRDAGDYTVGSKYVPGYIFVGATCTAGDDTQTAAPGETITIESGLLHVCTYNFTAKPLRVLFQTVVISDDGGNASIYGPRLLFGSVNTRHGQFRKLPAGDYTLDAVVPAGYDFIGVQCTDRWNRPVTITNGVLEGAPTLWLTCTYTFDDIASS